MGSGDSATLPAVGSGTHYGQWYWDPALDVLDLVTETQGLASNRCIDTWFDWLTGGEGTSHYDARVTRVCRSDANRDSEGASWYWEPNTSASLMGAQKRAMCPYNTNTKQLVLSNCVERAGDISTVNAVFTAANPNPVTRAWIRQADGDPVISDLGYPASATQ